jgi:hypothetical protein
MFKTNSALIKTNASAKKTANLTVKTSVKAGLGGMNNSHLVFAR